jgi:hypothetical protein
MNSIIRFVNEYNNLVQDKQYILIRDERIQKQMSQLMDFSPSESLLWEINNLQEELNKNDEQLRIDIDWELSILDDKISGLLIKFNYLGLEEILEIATDNLLKNLLLKKQEIDNILIIKKNSNIEGYCKSNIKINNFVFLNGLNCMIPQGIKFKFIGDDTEFILGCLNSNIVDRKIIIEVGSKYRKNGLIKLVQVSQDLILDEVLEIKIRKGNVYNFGDKELVFGEDSVILI